MVLIKPSSEARTSTKPGTVPSCSLDFFEKRVNLITYSLSVGPLSRLGTALFLDFGKPSFFFHSHSLHPQGELTPFGRSNEETPRTRDGFFP